LGAAAAAPLVVPGVLSVGATARLARRRRRAAPNERVTLGAVGVGGQGQHLVGRFLEMPDVQVVALCDVDANHLEPARQRVAAHYGTNDCAALTDFRELVARDDIDAVVVATPDHWHGLVTVAALNHGKDVYCEKPLANSIAEGRAICQAAQRAQRIVQTGSHERANPNARLAAELVRSGALGRLETVRIQLPMDEPHQRQAMALDHIPPPETVPAGLDYDFWLGPASKQPYTPQRCHFWWRFILEYGGGEMTDRGAHIIDLAQLAAGTDATGPTLIEARGQQTPGSLFDAFMSFEFTNTYDEGWRLVGSNEGPRGLRLEGDRGWIFIHVHGCQLEMELASTSPSEVAAQRVELGRSPGHQRDFIECVKSRRQPMAPAEVGHRTATICHLNNIAMRLGRALKWDPVSEQVVGDEEANRLVTPAMRAPWSLS